MFNDNSLELFKLFDELLFKIYFYYSIIFYELLGI